MRRFVVLFFLAACAGAPRNEPVPIVLGSAPVPATVPRCSEKNAESCRRGCDAGKQEDCAVYASLLVMGNGVPQDFAPARALADSSCKAGVFRGCNALALIFEDGKGGPKDEARAIELYRLACDGKEWRACANIARLEIAKHHLQLGVDFHVRACKLGGIPSCLNGGAYLAPGGGADDPPRAAELFRIGCDAGDLDCCNGLGTSYARGSGVPQDDARATELFRRACDGNVGIGCKGLGDMLAPADPAQAQVAYKRSCELGYARGCERAGLPAP